MENTFNLTNCLYQNPYIPSPIKWYVFRPYENYFENKKELSHWIGQRPFWIIAEIVMGIMNQMFALFLTLMGHSSYIANRFKTGGLHEAVMRKDVTLVEWILKEYPDWVNEKSITGHTPLDEAILAQSLPCVQLLLIKNADIQIKSNTFSPLRQAIEIKLLTDTSFAIIKELVNHRADINELDENIIRNLEQANLDDNLQELMEAAIESKLLQVIMKPCDSDNENFQKQIIQFFLEKGATLYPKLGAYYFYCFGAISQSLQTFLRSSPHVLAYFQKEWRENRQYFNSILQKLIEEMRDMGKSEENILQFSERFKERMTLLEEYVHSHG